MRSGGTQRVFPWAMLFPIEKGIPPVSMTRISLSPQHAQLYVVNHPAAPRRFPDLEMLESVAFRLTFYMVIH